MAAGQPARLVVLDFSGTLSLQAALFAREESLLRELKESGLWRCGVQSVRMFWEEIVNPTWQEGSTTGKGYQLCLFERVRRIAATLRDPPPATEVWASASRFVDSYLRHSTIDPGWKGVLRDLARRETLAVVVASDHYAEATGHIIAELAALGVAAGPALERGAQGVLVANSADLGHHKATRAFWQRLKEERGLGLLARVAIVDDFGFNEQPQDAYASLDKIMARLRRTVTLLSDVFEAHASVFPFFLSQLAAAPPASAESRERAYGGLIAQARRFLSRAMAE